MTMHKFLFIALLLSINTVFGQSQKVVADCTVSFSVTVNETGAAGTSSLFNNATKTLYIKGYEVRSDIESSSFIQSTIYNGRTTTAVILREIGGNKYMTVMDAAKWKEQNKKYDGMKVDLTNDSKTILGYTCKKAVVTLTDGSTLNLFYATEIIPSTNENNYQFKDIPGFVLEYESETDKGKNKITFTATKINLSPVPAAKFEIPKSGYKML